MGFQANLERIINTMTKTRVCQKIRPSPGVTNSISIY
jgi:hypothetical protein